MECPFVGINKKNCLKYFRCEGILHLLQNFTPELNKIDDRAARYILLRSSINKLHDYGSDLTKKSPLYPFKPLFRGFYTLTKFMFRDPLGINATIISTEETMAKFERSAMFPLAADQIREYFSLTGRIYGLIFYRCAYMYSKHPGEHRRYYHLGKSVGSLVNLRDAVKDLKNDLKTDRFNPLRGLTSGKRKKIIGKLEAQYKGEILTSVAKDIHLAEPKNREGDELHKKTVSTQPPRPMVRSNGQNPTKLAYFASFAAIPLTGSVCQTNSADITSGNIAPNSAVYTSAGLSILGIVVASSFLLAQRVSGYRNDQSCCCDDPGCDEETGCYTHTCTGYRPQTRGECATECCCESLCCLIDALDD